MITITSFTNAHQSYTAGQIPWRLLQDQAAVLIGICESHHTGVADARDISQADIAWLLQQPESGQAYADLLGGNMSICETTEDLHRVVGCDFEFGFAHGRWPCVLDMPLVFDQCNYLDETEGEPQWAVVITIFSDAGGEVFYLPRHLWTAARIEKHMAATNAVWQGKP